MGGHGEERRQANYMLELSEELMLRQMVETPTRLENTLDLFFTNNEELVIGVSVEDTIMSDHRLVVIETPLGFPASEERRHLEMSEFDGLNLYHRDVDWNLIRNVLSLVKWKENLENKSVQEIYEVIVGELLRVCSKHANRKTSSFKRNKIPRDRKILMLKRGKLLKRMNSRMNEVEKENIRSVCAEIEEKLHESHIRE